MKHLLVTNDFPPKIGGIQSYLWELWRRLDPADVTVLTTPYAGAAAWDKAQGFRVVRTKQKWLLPTKSLVRQINTLAHDVGAELVVLDPVLPLGLVGPRLDLPYVAIGHGAEYAIPARLPFTRHLISAVTRRSVGMIAGGEYVAGIIQSVAKSSRNVPIISVPPGVDPQRFTPRSTTERVLARQEFAIGPDATVVLGISRLVPRKGFDRLIIAAAQLRDHHPNLEVVIAGAGRSSARLTRLIQRHNAPVRLLGRVADEALPSLYGAADIFCMPCHDRWLGLEREGFGIVLVEAGAAGLCSVAGVSGGSAEAVIDGQTGLMVGGRVDARDVAQALDKALSDVGLRERLGQAARVRVEADYAYMHLAERLGQYLSSCVHPSVE